LLAWIEKTGEELFIGEQAGPPSKRKGDMDYNNRIVFGVLGYLFEIKMLIMWRDGVYIYDEYGSLSIASRLNQISDMKAGIIRLLEFMMIIKTEVKNNVTAEYDNDSIQILKRKFDEIIQTKQSPNK
ncbi:2357_t:CDS:2, partial [Acaulospora colombiana]